MEREAVERVARAIAQAADMCAYGLYDYTSYPGTSEPHVVRDEKTGQPVFVSHSRDEAEKEYERLRDAAIARAAIAEVMAILGEPTSAMHSAGNRAQDDQDQTGVLDIWGMMLSASPLSQGGQE